MAHSATVKQPAVNDRIARHVGRANLDALTSIEVTRFAAGEDPEHGDLQSFKAYVLLLPERLL